MRTGLVKGVAVPILYASDAILPCSCAESAYDAFVALRDGLLIHFDDICTAIIGFFRFAGSAMVRATGCLDQLQMTSPSEKHVSLGADSRDAAEGVRVGRYEKDRNK